MLNCHLFVLLRKTSKFLVTLPQYIKKEVPLEIVSAYP